MPHAWRWVSMLLGCVVGRVVHPLPLFLCVVHVVERAKDGS